jgi:hypothetical protein
MIMYEVSSNDHFLSWHMDMHYHWQTTERICVIYSSTGIL